MEVSVNKTEVSKRLRSLVRKKLACLDIDRHELSFMSGVHTRRLNSLLEGRSLFNSYEIQILCILLGIDLEDVFPAPPELENMIAERFNEITEEGTLVFAAAGKKRRNVNSEDPAFQRTMVMNDYYIQCLAQLS